jgi:hypothetical protein
MALTKATYGMISADTSSIDLNIDANTLYVDSSANKVGIGTNSPDAPLRIDQNANEVGFKVTGGGSGYNLAEFVRDVGATATIAINASGADPQMYFTSTGNTFSIGVNSNSFEIADSQHLGTNTRLSIDYQGNMGIGTSTPTEILTLDDTHPKLALRDAGTERAFLQVDSSDNFVINNKSISNMIFETSDTERMRLDSSGRFMVGTTNIIPGVSNTDAGVSLSASLGVFASRANEAPINLSRNSSDGDIALFRKDGSTVGSIGTNSGYLVIGSPVGSDAHLLIGNGLIHPATSTGSGKDDAIVIGSATNRFKDLHLSGTAGVNALDIKSGSSIHGTITTSSSSLTLNARNTGIMLFQSGGSEKARIDGSGNLGIGTTSPAKILEIFGSGSESGILIKNNANTNYRGIYLGALEADNTAYGKFHMSTQTGELNITAGASGYGGLLTIDTNGSEKMRIASDGAVTLKPNGITTGLRLQGRSADNNFFIQWNSNNGSTNYAMIGTDSGNATLQYSANNHKFVNQLTNTEYMRIKSDGNVGIGITDPDQALEIGAGGKLKLSRADNSRSMLLYTNNSDCVVQSDTDPLHLQSANRMTFATNGASERMRIATDGKIGIGTATPSTALHITGANDNTNGQVKIHASGGAGADAQVAFLTNSNGRGIYVDDNDTNKMKFYSGYGKGAAGKEVTFDNEGRVGVGNTNPDKPLTITSDSGANGIALRARSADDYSFIQFFNNAGSALRGQIYSHSNSIGFTTGTDSSAGNDLYIKDGGNVGIGTSTPDLTLDVTHATAAQYIATFQNTGSNLQLKLGMQAQGYINIQGARIDNGNPYNLSLQADGSNVGIGTTIPSKALHVNAGTAGGIMCEATQDNTLSLKTSSGGTKQWNIGNYYTTWAGLASPLIIQPVANSGNMDIAICTATNTPAQGIVVKADGDVGIGMTDTQGSRLGVSGSLRLSGGNNDLASVSTGTGSIVASGSITHTIGYAGTYASGKKWVWTYAATSWKSFHVTLRVSGTAGFSTYEGGGYNNNGGPTNTGTQQGANLGSFVITRSGQNIVMTYTASTQTIHPFFELTYRQSGGDGSPYMSKLSLVQS